MGLRTKKVATQTSTKVRSENDNRRKLRVLYPRNENSCVVILYILCHTQERLDMARVRYGAYSWAKPILMKYQDMTCENAFWQQLLEIQNEWREYEMVGTLSCMSYEKIDLETVNNVITQGKYKGCYYWHFKGTKTRIEGEWMDKQHPHFMQIWNEVLTSLTLETTTDNHCNYWMCTPAMMLKFIEWFSGQLYEKIMSHSLALIDSKYDGSVPVADRLQKWGIPHYPLVTFVMERIHKCFFDKGYTTNLETMNQYETITVYCYRETGESCENLEFFLEHGINTSSYFLFLINGKCTVTIPGRNNIGVVYHMYDNIKLLLTYLRGTCATTFYFVNSTSRGPFLPCYENDSWCNLLKRRLQTDTACMVSPVVEFSPDNLPFLPTYFFGLNRLGYDIFEKIVEGELIDKKQQRSISKRMLEEGGKLYSLLSQFENVDLADPGIWCSTENVAIHPCEVMFVDTTSVDLQVSVQNYSRWKRKVKCVIVAIAKGEKLYIEEFIQYYLKLGCSNIFIYDNSEDNELKQYKSDRVTVIPFSGGQQQLPAYSNFLQKYKNQYDYVAFFDVDEFLVLKKHKHIVEFCKEYIKSGALGVNWYMFGNNGNTKYENKPVLARFTRRENKMNRHVKTIGRCRDILEMGVHNPTKMRQGCYFKNTFGEKIEGPFNEHTDDSVVQLNHYFSKSDEELHQKCERGRADIIQKRKYEEYVAYLNFNEVEDKSALKE